MYERSADTIPLREVLSGPGERKPLPTKDLARFIFFLKIIVDSDDIYGILRA